MPKTNPETRVRLVATAADLLRRRGMHATSIRELAKAANAPLGSTYHYFPDGKKQVITEAVQFAGNSISAKFGKSLEQGAVAGLDAILQFWREVITNTKFRAGCPVLAVAMEEATSDDAIAAHKAAAEVFEQWCLQLQVALMEEGLNEPKATALATMVVASAEGALAMCRATKKIEHFDHVADMLRAMLTSELQQLESQV